MSSYQHKKFDLKTENYSHKKFGPHMNKRKHEDFKDNENKTTITAQTILQKAANEQQQQQQQQTAAKRRKTQPLFRPWLDDDNKIKATSRVNQQTSIQPQVLTAIPPNIMSYHPNMARQHPTKERSEREQQRRNRNTLACLLNRRNKQAEQLHLQQQYVSYQQKQAAVMQEYIRSAHYLRHLQQLALQRQQLLFVFGNQ